MKHVVISKNNVATFIALLFHVSGCIGMFTSSASWFIQNTPLNLLLMFGLVIWTHQEKNRAFFIFLLIAFATGMVTEMIGVNTSLLFGKYVYGNVLGIKLYNVPLLIGINWFVIIYCAGVAMSFLHTYIEVKMVTAGHFFTPQLQMFSLIIDGALLATFFDYIMEPAAVKLGFWQWHEDVIPLKNYASWFMISVALLYVFSKLTFNKHNQFAIHLLIIQLLFFGLIRSFL